MATEPTEVGNMGKLYAYEVVWGEDWGHGADIESGFEYGSPEAAFEYGVEALREAESAGKVDGPTGIYIYEDLSDDDHEDDRNAWLWTPDDSRTLYSLQADPDIDLRDMPAGKVDKMWKGWSVAAD